ncbi:MAG: gliding motility-associated C-terminal domain-containing protein, partial [Gemmatimonadota bacterium]|nr:gliding motility-associated C-terminal domain-containing protein [Gemmatimonadota bacterium]
ANGVVDSETTVVLALERGELLGDLQVDRVFTPNGDGVNDELEVSFSLLRVLSSAPVQVAVYDLSGRLVTRIAEETITAGRHTVAWTGVDQSRAIVPPGIYLMRIDLDVDSTSKKNTSVHRLVHVAY